MYCRNCGRMQEEGQRYCPKCGEPFMEENKGTNDENKKYAQATVGKIHKEETACHEQDVYSPIHEPPTDNAADTIEPYKSGHSSKRWLWIIVFILLLGIVGGGWYFFDEGYFGNKAMVSIEETDPDEESPNLSKGFYVEVSYGYYFYIPRFLREGEQQGELAKDNSAFYENKGYSLNISVDECDIESQFWMYNTMRSRNGDDAYEESMITKNKDYWKVDDKSGSILLIMQSKDDKMCGTMYFTYPKGGKAIIDDAIEKSIEKTRENDV